jgi:thiol-disulfide isomerase/thioredoxin
VVVLDFWNTWCPVCRSIGPDTRALARELADEPVRFFGVNLYETSDPAAYWREIGEPYPLLLEGEEVARALDLPWQPGIAVIGPEGTLLYKQLGASADRIEKVRAAIEEGLERAPTGR